MATRSYLNFDISLERTGEFYRARVLQSCAGEADYEFELPFSELELENFILRMGHARSLPGRKLRGSDSPELQAAKRFGGKLFETIFQGDVYACLRSSMDEAYSKGQGVRLMLRLDPELADIPWEYLYNPAWNQFFALSTDTPLVRYINLTPSIHPLLVKPPLRLLVVISSPEGYPPLNVEYEWQNLLNALEPLVRKGLLEIDRLGNADMLSLQRQLRRNEYHIFHFIGHGTYEENTEDGMLLFTDEFGHGKPSSGQSLGTLLHDHHTLRLALLNACEGARTGRADPFAGVAQGLVQMGLPAVIAMQFAISDNTAILFAQEFYAALADGYPVDAALTDARKAIFSSNDREWVTPVLFTRTLDGRIFELTQLSEVQSVQTVKESATPLAKSRQSKEELEAMRLYEDGLSAFYLEDWGRAIDSFRAVLQLQPDHANAKEKLALAQHQQDIAQRYALAQQQCAALDWETAVQTLEKLVEDAPQYRDVATLLLNTRKRARLAELYEDASRLSQAGQWAAVISIFEQMRQIDPACPDQDGLLPAAKKAISEVDRQEKLVGLYQQSLKAMEASDWREARKQLEQVERIQPGYRDAGRLLAKAKAELARPAAPPKPPSEKKVTTAPPANPAGEAISPGHKFRRWIWLVAGIGGFIVMAVLATWGIDRIIQQDRLTQQSITTQTALAKMKAFETQTAEAELDLIDELNKQMVLIPAGKFLMGSESGAADESPVHWVNLTEAFSMDKYEVTNAAYAACVDAGACSDPGQFNSISRNSYYGNPAYANNPVVFVSWYQAQVYCKWRGGSLPTEAQWEYAARGGLEGKQYPWGDEEPVCMLGVDNGAAYFNCVNDTVPVGRYVPNGYGLYDMAGNVWEWVADWYQNDYYSTYPQDGWPDNPLGPVWGEEGHVFRGGAYDGDNSGFIRVGLRYKQDPLKAEPNIGFRCVLPGNK